MNLNSPATVFFGDFRETLLQLMACHSSEVPFVTETITTKVAGEMTAIVSLNDSQFSASITVTTTEASAVSLSYLPRAEAGNWLVQLTNQLALRMKDKLTSYDLAPTLGFATMVRGKWIQIESGSTSACLLTARFKHGEVTAQLALEASPGLKLNAQQEHKVTSEGVTVAF